MRRVDLSFSKLFHGVIYKPIKISIVRKIGRKQFNSYAYNSVLEHISLAWCNTHIIKPDFQAFRHYALKLISNPGSVGFDQMQVS